MLFKRAYPPCRLPCNGIALPKLRYGLGLGLPFALLSSLLHPRVERQQSKREAFV